MLRITHAYADAATASLRIEGRLTQAELPRFQQTCAELLAAGAQVQLELSGLQFADRDGVVTLRSLRSRGVTLRGASGFVEALLAVSDV